MNPDHYTYRVTWSPEDGEHVGLCVEFPSLSWLAATPEAALLGIRQMVSEAVADMQSTGGPFPSRWRKNTIAANFEFGFPLKSTVL